MNRRKFVSLGAVSLCVVPVFGLTAFTEKQNYGATKPAWLVDLIKLNDGQVKDLMAFKVKDTGNKYFGGYYNWAEMVTPHSTIGFIIEAGCAVATEESAYYKSKELLTDLEQALAALLKLQHTDGTIDLVDTNFHSTPDTGFMVKRMVPVYKIIKQSGITGTEKILSRLEIFLKNAGEALITGGIHTPNHRWVVSAALTKLNEQWPDKRYVNRVEEWLAERIDLDPDGQYTEKSTYGYSAVIDRVLITVSKGLHKPELLDAVRKNILMMRYYIHPNGEVVTEASNRQDKGQIGTMENYYYACRYLSLLDNNGEMAMICRMIEKKSFAKLTEFLNYFLEDTFLWKELPPTQPLPTEYVKEFPYSGVVRIRHGQWDATILKDNPGWLTFHKGDAVLQAMRVAASFFGKGQFQSENLQRKDNTWLLTKKLEGAYFQPYPKDEIPEGSSDYSKMPKANRKQTNIQYFQTDVLISETNSGITVDISITGTDDVPVTLEMIFRPGGNFSGVEEVTGKQNSYLLRDKLATYTKGKDSISFGPGAIAHKNIQLRGALPAMDAPTVYVTGFTPFKHRITLS